MCIIYVVHNARYRCTIIVPGAVCRSRTPKGKVMIPTNSDVELNCPVCRKILRIPARYRGQTGTCNGCGSPVSVPLDEPAESAALPMTEAQRDYLISIGTSKAQLHKLTVAEANALIEKAQRAPDVVATEPGSFRRVQHGGNLLFGCFGCSGLLVTLSVLLSMCTIGGTNTSIPDTPHPAAVSPTQPIVTTAPVAPITTAPIPAPKSMPPKQEQQIQKAQPFQAQQHHERTVYVASTGRKYHNQGCRTLRNGSSPVGLSAAKANGYEACKVCNPGN